MIIILKNKYTLQVDEFFFKCSVGKNGCTKKKIEGDKKTPKGTFSIEHLYFRKDRLDKPQTTLKCIEISKCLSTFIDLYVFVYMFTHVIICFYTKLGLFCINYYEKCVKMYENTYNKSMKIYGNYI